MNDTIKGIIGERMFLLHHAYDFAKEKISLWDVFQISTQDEIGFLEKQHSFGKAQDVVNHYNRNKGELFEAFTDYTRQEA